MTKKASLLLFALVLGALVVACGQQAPEVDTQATEIAAGVAATLTTQAPLPTVVVTPPPPTVVVTPPPPTEAAPSPTVEPTASPDPMSIRLEADGSGDYATLAEAIGAAPEGATISLGAGAYRLEETIDANHPVNLVGAGMDDTELVSIAAGPVLRFRGSGPFSVQDITLAHDGAEAADAVEVDGATIRFVRCRFTGGVYDDQTGDGSGLYIHGSASGEIRDCDVSRNQFHGLLLMDDAALDIEGNKFNDNGDTGIVYTNQTGGTAKHNECSGNKRHGIYLRERAAPSLEENRCLANDSSGISYWGEAGGLARGNVCSGNAVHGIGVEENAHPDLKDNVLDDNGDAGIAYFDNAAGLAQGNSCSGNAAHGIYVGNDAAPALVDNECALGGTVAQEPPSPGAESKIAFALTRDGNQDIYVMNADGSELVRLTDNPADDMAPIWSPGGSRLAFLSTRENNGQIYVMNADGSQQTRLTDSRITLSPPTWSPDGTHLAFTSYAAGQGDDIYAMAITDRMDAEGQGAIRLTDDPGSDRDPTWSPDGTRLAFITDRDGYAQVYVMNADGSEQTPLADMPGSVYGVRWSPDGKRLLFVFDNAVHVMNADGSNVRRVTGEVDFIGRSAWSPDGAHIIFPQDGDFYLVKADGSGMVRLTDGLGGATHPDWWGPAAAGGLPPVAKGPLFNPDGDPWCFNVPQEVAAGDWQVVAPREVVVIGDKAEIDLRNQAATSTDAYPITARIIAPDGSEARAETRLTGNDWISLVYPDDFGPGEIGQRGAYTIIWESEGTFIACDGFIVGGGASQ